MRTSAWKSALVLSYCALVFLLSSIYALYRWSWSGSVGCLLGGLVALVLFLVVLAWAFFVPWSALDD